MGRKKLGNVQKNTSIPQEMNDWLKENYRSASKLLQQKIKEEMDREKRELMEKENQEGKK